MSITMNLETQIHCERYGARVVALMYGVDVQAVQYLMRKHAIKPPTAAQIAESTASLLNCLRSQKEAK